VLEAGDQGRGSRRIRLAFERRELGHIHVKRGDPVEEMTSFRLSYLAARCTRSSGLELDHELAGNRRSVDVDVLDGGRGE
jgi:hypothetical protein